MKYALVLRKIQIDEDIYYQAIKKVKGIINENDELEEIDEEQNVKTSYKELLSDSDLETQAFIEIGENDYEGAPNDLVNYNFFLKNVDNSLLEIEGAYEKEKVKLAFYNMYHDFKIVPDYNLDEVIENAKNALNEKVKGQDKVIENILSKIYNNQMFLNCDMSMDEVLKYKTNMLIMGPHGTGKTTIKEVLKNSLAPIPIIEYELTGDVSADINAILRSLIVAADGNITLAEKGIVIFDSMKEKNAYFSDEGDNLYLEELRTIMEHKELFSVENGEKLFNYGTVTNIVMFDIDYSHEEIKDVDTYYYRLNFDSLSDLGFDPHIIYDLFNEEIIYMNEMDYDLALSILKDKKISPLYKIKEVLEKNNKKLIFNEDFIERLIEQGLDLDEGFEGIIRLLNYLTQKKSVKGKNIKFTVEDLENLKVGTTAFDNDYDENEYSYKNNKQNSSNSKLKVDANKRTINGLSVMDAVNIVTNKIKGQDEQAFRIVNSLYNQIMNRYKNFNREEVRDLKSSVLLIGGTGVGKTAILEKLATIFNIPYVREDATRFSGTGIVGDDVEDILKDLVKAAHGNREEAENGIVFLDEFDKLAANTGNRVDIGGDVQRSLLTLLEGAKVAIRPGMKDYFEPYEFDTTNVIFYAGGAFDGIDEIVKRRILKQRGNKIGFGTETPKEIINKITTDDIGEFGIDRQLAGRLPNVIHLNNLNEKVLLDIINSEEGFVNLSRKSYEFEGVKLTLSEKFKETLAHKSLLDKKGARSIKTIFSKLLDYIDLERAKSDIEEVILDGSSIDNPNKITYVKRKI